VLGVQIQGLRFGRFHEAPDVHHGDAVRNVLDDAEVVSHKQIGQPVLFLEVLQQIEGLRLDGDVQGGNGLVADHQLRVERQGAGDADALTLTAGKGVWEAPHVLRVESDDAEELCHAILQFVAFDAEVHRKGLADNIEQRHARVQGAVRILEDHLGVGAHLSEGLRIGSHDVHRADVRVMEDHLARCGLNGTQDAAARGRLAAP